jgi:hypothetical protein
MPKYEVALEDGTVEIQAEFLQAGPTGDWIFSDKKAIQPPGLKPGEFLTEPTFIARAFKYIKIVEGDSNLKLVE